MGNYHSIRGSDGRVEYFFPQNNTDRYATMIGGLLSPQKGGQSWSDVKKMSLNEAARVSEFIELFHLEVKKQYDHNKAMEAMKAKR